MNGGLKTPLGLWVNKSEEKILFSFGFMHNVCLKKQFLQGSVCLWHLPIEDVLTEICYQRGK